MIDAIVGTVVPVAGVAAPHILLRATVVLCLAGLVTLTLKRASAADRYAVWSVGFVVLAALPVLSLALPSWDLGQPAWMPAAVAEQTTVIVEGSRASTYDTGAVGLAATEIDTGSSSRLLGAGGLLAAVGALWLGGAALLLLRLMLHVARVSRTTQRAPEGSSPELIRLAVSVMQELGIRRPVRVAVSEEVTMPFSWGVDNPVVVFPETVSQWPAARKRSVMWHEMAHVARLDYPLHLLVEVARALYWPNPLVWLAARRMAMERERACDDLALRNGTPAGDYATHLIDIARSQVEGYAPVGATTMAGEPGLLERVRYVMNERLDRSPLGRDRLLLSAVLAVVLALPLASFDIMAMTEKVPTTEQCSDDLLDHGDYRVRQRAAWWLGEHESHRAVRPLEKALADPSPEVRLAAGWALGEIKDEGSIRALTDALQDRDPLVREMAALALGEIEDPSAIDPLLRALRDDEELRGAVAWALGEIQGDRASDARDEVFDDWGRRPRRNQQVWTGDLPRRTPRWISEDVDAVVEQLRGGDPELRRQAALNLGVLGIRRHYDSVGQTLGVVDALLEALSDPVPEVRAAAVWSLDEINPSRHHHGHDRDHEHSSGHHKNLDRHHDEPHGHDHDHHR